MSCGVGRRRDLDPMGLWLWLWLWRRPEATAPIRPLAWEPPHAAGLALKSRKRKEGEKEVGARGGREGGRPLDVGPGPELLYFGGWAIYSFPLKAVH